VVECTALEMRHTGNRIGGSNPSLSATLGPFGASGGRPPQEREGAKGVSRSSIRSVGRLTEFVVVTRGFGWQAASAEKISVSRRITNEKTRRCRRVLIDVEFCRRNHIGGVTPSRPIRQARPCSVPSACLTATMKTLAPGLMSLLSPGT
jgi:hypothetical protein